MSSLLRVLAYGVGAPVVRRKPNPATGPLANIGGWMEASSHGKSVPDRDRFVAVTEHFIFADTAENTAYFEWVLSESYGPDVGAEFSFEYSINGGPFTPVTVGGQPSFRVDVPLATQPLTVTSDPLPDYLLRGDTLTVRHVADADGDTGGIPSSYSGTDGLQTWALRPARIVAPSEEPSWLCVGDSIAQQGNSYPIQATVLARVPATLSAQGGDSYTFYPNRFDMKVKPHLAHSKHVIDQFGVNDTKQVNALRYWKNLRSNGVECIVKTTILPTASSTDKFATLEGQTPARQPGIHDFNTWLRDGAPLAPDLSAPAEVGDTGAVRCGYIDGDGNIRHGDPRHPISYVSDVSLVIESSPGSGKFVPGWPYEYYGDGLHPGAGIHQLAAERLARDIRLLGF